MVEAGGEPRLTEQALAKVIVLRYSLSEQLQGDRTPQSDVERP
jgi:hypothetical protein